MEHYAEAFAGVSGVQVVTLGGSRGQGTNHADADWDFGLYYRGHLDPAGVEALGFDGEVFAPGDWAGFMNGGAFLTIDGHKVDLIYRDLDEQDRVTALAEEGSFELARVPGYLVGMASYVLLGEAAVSKVLVGELERPRFPRALRERAPERWKKESDFALMYAVAHGRRGDVTACAGSLAQACLATAYGRLCARGEWALNDKDVLARVDLAPTWAELAALGSGPDELEGAVERVRSMLG